MQISEIEKFKAQLVMVVTFRNHNEMTMYGMVFKNQTKPKITPSERMSIEDSNFRAYVEKNRHLVLSATIYKNNYVQNSGFRSSPELYVKEWNNGFWTDQKVQNVAQFAAQ